MLERNVKIKKSPERWFDHTTHHNIVLCFEDRVFDSVIEDFQARDTFTHDKSVHVINLNVKDNAEEAQRGAEQILKLCKDLGKSDDWENDINSIISKWEQEVQRKLLHVVFYD